MSEIAKLPVQAVAGRPRLVAEMHIAVSARQLAHQTLNRFGSALDLTQIANLAITTTLRNGHGMLRLRCVERDENLAILRHGPPSMLETRLGQTRATLVASYRHR